MALTKITSNVIEDGAITSSKLATGALDSQVSSYLSTNSYATTGDISTAIAGINLNLDGLSDAKTLTNAIYIGSGAGSSDTTNGSNLGIGKNALAVNVGTSNVAIGNDALKSLINTGDGNGGNIGIGTGAAESAVSNTSCIYIGNGIYPGANNATHEIVIGNSVIGNGANTIKIGDSFYHTDTYLAGRIRLSSAIVANTTTTATSKTLTNGEMCAVTAAGQTLTLPASPNIGDNVTVFVGNFVNTVIARNGSNIMALAEDFTIDAANVGLTFVYTDATYGWRIK